MHPCYIISVTVTFSLCFVYNVTINLVNVRVDVRDEGGDRDTAMTAQQQENRERQDSEELGYDRERRSSVRWVKGNPLSSLRILCVRCCCLKREG